MLEQQDVQAKRGYRRCTGEAPVRTPPGAEHRRMQELEDEQRLLKAHIDVLRQEIRDRENEHDHERGMLETERDIARRKLADHLRDKADWSFEIDGNDVHVRFDGPGTSYPGCPPLGGDPLFMSRFFDLLRAAAPQAQPELVA